MASKLLIMKLHDAIEKVIRSKGRPMSTNEIAVELNKNQWYKKKDGSTIQAFQIRGRTNNYVRMFSRNGSMVSLIGQSQVKSAVTDKKTIGNTKELIPVIKNKVVDVTLLEKILLNEKNFKSASTVDAIVPDKPGLYCIRITDISKLASPFNKLLIAKGHNILYIGIASTSLKRRFLGQELRARDTARRTYIKNKPWIENLTVKTFHALCYKLIKDAGGATFDNKFRLLLDDSTDDFNENNSNIAPEKYFNILHKMLLEQCKDVNYLLRLKRYILDFYVDKISINKEMASNSYPNQIKYTTLKGEKVKSKSERDIADWLYRHNIKYTYEPIVNLKDFPFRPDFYIPQADLFLEHISDKSYKTTNKEEQFIAAGRNYVKTFESMTQDSTLFNLALERIIKGRITDTLSQLSALNYEEEFKTYGEKIKEFLRMISRVQSVIKGNGIDKEHLLMKSETHQHERVKVFYELAIPVIKKYNEYCVNRSYLDFDDLIIQSIHLLEQRPELRQHYHERYKHILVDEFQDVNNLQVKLLELLLTPDTNLFCVGDDWQSIYGFRGSEVDYIVNFEKHFPGSEVLILDVNYRSTQNIVGASNEVIKRNKNQISKSISAYNQTPSKIQIYKAKDTDDGVDYLVKKVSDLYQAGINQENILVLYRRSKMFWPYGDALKHAGLKVTAKTIHASKGLEAKAVFIIGLTEGSGGFPDVWLDDAIFRVIKDVKHDMLIEEERRLFYVALTRAKDELFLITEFGNESSFIDEIPAEFYSSNTVDFRSVVDTPLLCEACKTQRKEYYKFCPVCGVKLS